jgi:phage-related tail fiber protein
VVENICAVETAVKDLTEAVAEEIRQDVAVSLRQSKLPRSNLTRGENNAVHTLRSDETKEGLPAHEGNATVIMTTERYVVQVSKILQEVVLSTESFEIL